MSRIDEALRLTKTGVAPEAPAADRQTLFKPAWTTNGGEQPGSEPEPEQVRPVEAAPAEIVEARTEPWLRPAVTADGALGFSSEWRERLANAPTGDASLIEQFRRLAATLHHAQRANGIRSVMVTSASPGDGKTLTAINLALVLSESYRYKVLLIDADLRRPSIPSVVSVADGTGLSEALRAATEQKLALVALTPGLTLLPAGQPIANSIEALTSPRMRQILEEAATRFDWIVIDAPPVGLTADARLLSEMVDGTLFVIRAAQTQFSQVQRAVDTIGRDNLLGVVLNGVESQPNEGYYGYMRPTENG